MITPAEFSAHSDDCVIGSRGRLLSSPLKTVMREPPKARNTLDPLQWSLYHALRPKPTSAQEVMSSANSSMAGLSRTSDAGELANCSRLLRNMLH
jgi:hypothetical protein